jgi:hypothetical protein
MTTKLLLVASIVCITALSGKDREKREISIPEMMAKSIHIALKDWAIRTEIEKQFYLSGKFFIMRGVYVHFILFEKKNSHILSM